MMGHTNGFTNEEFDWAYENVREGMPIGETIEWDVVCESYFGLAIPQDTGSEWTAHVQKRNAVKKAVNDRASAAGDNWRLYVINGRGVIREQESVMVERSTEHHIRKIGNSFRNVGRNLSSMLNSDGLTNRDRRLIRGAVAIGDGGLLAVAGMIQQLSIAKPKRQELIAALGIWESEEEEDEVAS